MIANEDFIPPADPFALFTAWYELARAHEPADAEAMALATAGTNGAPDLRMVLMKGHDARGFVFFTNSESRKGAELAADPRAALCFHWKSLQRQVRIEGGVTPVAPAEADAYFATRPRGSRIGAWASAQSRVLADRAALERAVAETGARFAGQDVPRPPYWNGYRVVPRALEFWQAREHRLHDRLRYRRAAQGAPWQIERLYP